MANARLNVSPSGDEWIKELFSRSIANYITTAENISCVWVSTSTKPFNLENFPNYG